MSFAETQRERGARVRFPPPLVFLSCILSGLGLQYVVPTPEWPVDRTITTAAGILIIAMGALLVLSARVLFFRTRQNPVPWKPTPELIFNGPYRFTRNPMYVGITLIASGVGVLRTNPWLLLFALIALSIVHVIAVLPEEKYLSEKFGAPYDAYRKRVRRYL